jgi:hypothetical protein
MSFRTPKELPRTENLDDFKVEVERYLRMLRADLNVPGPIDYIDFNIDYEDGSAEGRLQWNSDDGTLEVGMPGGSVNLQIGQEILIKAKNDFDGEIADGTPVYITGADGTNVTIDKADADFAAGDGFGLRTIGVATETFASKNSQGYITTNGVVRDIDTSMFAAEGVPVYLAVGGGFAMTPPDAPDITYVVGVVLRKSSTVGSILVTQTSLPNLNSLSDVDITGLTDGQNLRWNSTDDVWEPSHAWDDWQGALTSNQLLNPSAHIARDSVEASLTFKTTCDLGDYVYMNTQMPHRWKLGTDISPHLHWWQTSSAQPNWLVQYRWQRNGETKNPAWTYHALTVNAFNYASGTLCQITAGAAKVTPPAGYNLSDVVQFRILRDVANVSGAFAGAEAGSVDADGVSFDFHFEIDTAGSREILSK